MNLSAVISQMAVLFLVLTIGYIANKAKILNSNSNTLLSKLVLNISMPCTILSSVMNGDVSPTGSASLHFLLMVLLSFVIIFIVAIPAPWLLRSPKSDKGIIRFLITFGNVAFMGYPVVQAIFGAGAVFYVTLFNIPFNLLLFSVGILMISGNKERISFKQFVTPALISSVIAVLIYILHIQMPQVIVDTSALVSRMTTPGAMLIIGSTLAAIPIKQVFTEWRIYPVMLIRLILLPILTFLVLRLFVSDMLILGILVIQAGMPAGTAAAMFSLQYGGNDSFASKGVFITTLISVVTIPLLVFLLFS